jgi:hypothetical protein
MERSVIVAGNYYDAAMRIKIALVSLGQWFNRRLISRFKFLTCIEDKQASHFFSYDQTRWQLAKTLQLNKMWNAHIVHDA